MNHPSGLERYEILPAAAGTHPAKSGPKSDAGLQDLLSSSTPLANVFDKSRCGRLILVYVAWHSSLDPQAHRRLAECGQRNSDSKRSIPSETIQTIDSQRTAKGDQS